MLTDVTKFKHCLIYLYISAKQKHHNTKNLFRTDGRYLDIYRLTLSHTRLLFFISNELFSSIKTIVDKMTAIRDLFEAFNVNLSRHYNLSFYTTIYEKLEEFRGKCAFRVGMPKKPSLILAVGYILGVSIPYIFFLTIMNISLTSFVFFIFEILTSYNTNSYHR